MSCWPRQPVSNDTPGAPTVRQGFNLGMFPRTPAVGKASFGHAAFARDHTEAINKETPTVLKQGFNCARHVVSSGCWPRRFPPRRHHHPRDRISSRLDGGRSSAPRNRCASNDSAGNAWRVGCAAGLPGARGTDLPEGKPGSSRSCRLVR